MNDQFDGSFREWAARGPHTPAEAAAREIVGALPPRQPGRFRRSGWLAAPAAPAVALLIAAIIWWPAREPQIERPLSNAPGVASPAATPGTGPPTVLVLPLDARTTLYLMLD